MGTVTLTDFALPVTGKEVFVAAMEAVTEQRPASMNLTVSPETEHTMGVLVESEM